MDGEQESQSPDSDSYLYVYTHGEIQVEAGHPEVDRWDIEEGILAALPPGAEMTGGGCGSEGTNLDFEFSCPMSVSEVRTLLQKVFADLAITSRWTADFNGTNIEG